MSGLKMIDSSVTDNSFVSFVAQQRPREPIVPQVPEISVQGGAM